MPDISNISNDVLGSLSIERTREESTNDSSELGKDAFLRLMVAQLQNQDPLNPTENGEFISQLAQFSSVEGIQNMNASLDNMANAFASSQALEASALVGRQVQVPTNTAELVTGQGVRGTVELASSVADLRVVIEAPNGEVVNSFALGSQTAGDVDFLWNGQNANGETVPEGQYQIRANAEIDGSSIELPVSLSANVNSVTLGNGTEMVLNVEGVGPVPLSSVRRLL